MESPIQSPALQTHREDGVLEVTLDRPKANAIDLATSRAMGEVFAGFRDDPDLRVAILRTAGDNTQSGSVIARMYATTTYGACLENGCARDCAWISVPAPVPARVFRETVLVVMLVSRRASALASSTPRG